MTFVKENYYCMILGQKARLWKFVYAWQLLVHLNFSDFKLSGCDILVTTHKRTCLEATL